MNGTTKDKEKQSILYENIRHIPESDYTQKNYSYMGYIFFMLNAINIVKNGIVDFYYCICYIFYETLISVIVII